ncbi:MAG: hypothetical protein QMC67_17275 [Candidatus Wallbacteria bacterium]
MATEKLQTFKCTTDFVTLKIVSEPYVVLTARGYAPVVDVENLADNVKYIFYIQALSVAKILEEFKKENEDKFTGISIKVKKESTDKFAPYIIEKI